MSWIFISGFFKKQHFYVLNHFFIHRKHFCLYRFEYRKDDVVASKKRDQLKTCFMSRSLDTLAQLTQTPPTPLGLFFPFHRRSYQFCGLNYVYMNESVYLLCRKPNSFIFQLSIIVSRFKPSPHCSLTHRPPLFLIYIFFGHLRN